MELTLTGASLTSDSSSVIRKQQQSQKTSKVPRPPQSAFTTNSAHGNGHQGTCTKKDDDAAAAVGADFATSASGQHRKKSDCDSHEHHEHHEHGHGGACCEKKTQQMPPGYKPIESIPIEKLLAQPAALFQGITYALKGGKFETFEYLANAVLKHEKEHGPFVLGQNVDVAEDVSGLGRRGEEGHSLVHWAAKRADDLRFIEYLTKVPKIDFHLVSADSVGMRPLHWAATEGSIPLVAIILKQLDSRSASTETATTNNPDDSHLHEHKSSNLVIDKSDPINARDKSGCTPLLIASQYGHADLAAFLIKRGADPNAVDDSRDTALHWAAYKGSVPVCGLLLHLNGVEEHLELQDSFGQTPLHLASLRGNVDVVSYLLEEAEDYVAKEGERRSRNGGGLIMGSRHGGTGSINRIAQFPGFMVSLKDRDGKTPLDLALKKKKAGCELVLREYMDRHCNPNRSILSDVAKSIRPFFSLNNWKSWFGLTPENGSAANSPKVIYWWVASHMLLGLIIEVTIYVPIFGSGNGRLWDYTWLHFFTIFSFIAMWTTFILVNKTDPGVLALNGPSTSNFGNSSSNCNVNCNGMDNIMCVNENGTIKAEMEKVTNDLRKQYEETLESFATETTSQTRKDYLPLCHSCHIAKPLRSKHCRVLNRCVLLFDHHCPFVGATIGLYNYKYFYLFLISFTSTEIFSLITSMIHIHRGTKFEIGLFILAVYLSLYQLMTIGLLIYHTQLIKRNLTTNEHQNVFRYTYLHDEYGRYYNRFNKGFFRNMLSRCSPGADSYVVDAGSHRPQTSVSSKTNNKSEEEKTNLLLNIV